MNVLRAGSTAEVLGEIRVPSTLGTFLRSFTHGHAQHLSKVRRHLLGALVGMLPWLNGQGLVRVDLDDTIREINGYLKRLQVFVVAGPGVWPG